MALCFYPIKLRISASNFCGFLNREKHKMREALNIIIWPWLLWLILVIFHKFSVNRSAPTVRDSLCIVFRLGLLCAILMELIYVAVNTYSGYALYSTDHMM